MSSPSMPSWARGLSVLSLRWPDLTGRKFGRWTVLYRAASRGNHRFWRCRCECGAEKDINTAILIGGVTRSCGCLRSDSPAIRRGPRHPAWKGDAAGSDTKRNRCRRLYPVLGPCQRCGKPARDRHHKDANPGNNDPSNVEILCRSCHMAVDGRTARLADIVRSRAPVPPKPCRVCQRLSKPLRKGRCPRCADFFRNHGRERVSTCNR
jgi:hypothetical protein